MGSKNNQEAYYASRGGGCSPTSFLGILWIIFFFGMIAVFVYYAATY